jgi:hypothetical protein
VRTSKARVVPTTEENGLTTATIAQRLRMMAAHRAEEILAEVPSTLRRLRTLLLVATISIPLFLAGLLAVLWHLGH